MTLCFAVIVSVAFCSSSLSFVLRHSHCFRRRLRYGFFSWFPCLFSWYVNAPLRDEMFRNPFIWLQDHVGVLFPRFYVPSNLLQFRISIARRENTRAVCTHIHGDLKSKALCDIQAR